MIECMEQFIAIRARNGRLAAVLHEADPAKLVILAHGYTGTKCESLRLFVQTARALEDAGFSALRFDFWGSGDSEGDFDQASPNSEIADLHDVIEWAFQEGFSSIGVIGLSLGGAVSIIACAQNPRVKALVTWSAVPKFAGWTKSIAQEGIGAGSPNLGGPKMETDRPEIDASDPYVSLKIPKLQIQGDNDLPGFVEGFRQYFPAALEPKEHVIIPGADHVFWTGHCAGR